jgi:hypothetical protein
MAEDDDLVPASAASPMPASSLLDSSLEDDDVRAVVVAAYNSPIEAEMAKSRLQTEGIDADLLDVHTASIGTHMTLAIGGVKVRVLEADAERAHEVLNQLGDFTLPDDFDDDEDEETALAENDARPDVKSLTSRALAAGVLGAIFFPPLNLYSLWLVWRAVTDGEPLGRAGRAKAWGAVAFDLIGLVWLAVLLRL